MQIHLHILLMELHDLLEVVYIIAIFQYTLWLLVGVQKCEQVDAGVGEEGGVW